VYTVPDRIARCLIGNLIEIEQRRDPTAIAGWAAASDALIACSTFRSPTA